MKVYHRMNKLFGRSYEAKLFAVAFVGTHVPLLAFVSWMLLRGLQSDPLLLRIALMALIATLVGTVLTMWLLHALLAPVRNSVAALDDYEKNRVLPALPEEGADAASRLMRGINRTLRTVDRSAHELERQALRDSLTGAFNRRGCEQMLAQAEVALAEMPDRAFCVVVLDMDNLKQINDQDGHAAGDHALVMLVQRLEAFTAGFGWVGRWGGDEFLMGVRLDASVLQQSLPAWIAQAASLSPPLRVSVGFADWQPGEAIAELYRRADAAMYRAKLEGGQRAVYDPPASHAAAVQ